VPALTQTENGIGLSYPDGYLSLSPVGDNGLRVRFAKTTNAAPTSLILLDQKSVPFKIGETANTVSITTVGIQAVIDRVRGVISFRDAGGREILKEKAGGRSLSAAIVDGEPCFNAADVFESPRNEALFGMGQFQNGYLNVRGLSRRLLQINTQIAIPVLVSSRGYCLLWHNYGLTEFNPVDTAVPLKRINNGEGNANEKIGISGLNKPSAARITRPVAEGVFDAKVDGDYAFRLEDGSGQGFMHLIIDGKSVIELENPHDSEGTIVHLVAGQHGVRVETDGPRIQLFARLIDETTTFVSPVADAVDYIVFSGTTPADALAAYVRASGTSPLLPRWGYGFWQCRERYSSQDELVGAVRQFRERQIPMDAVVQDWQYWGKYGWSAMRFDESKYPDMRAGLKEIHDLNAHCMISVWCNTGKDTDAGKECVTNNLYLPGSQWLDMLNPAARALHWRQMDSAFFSLGMDAWWKDATEPENDALHNTRTFLGAGDRYRLTYPLFVSRGVYEGQRGTSENKRVVTLTRSAFAGEQRYAAAVWSGDIHATWKVYKDQIPAGLDACMSGVAYWTTDIGGFWRPADQYTSEDYHELLIRWFEFGTFCPLLRIHGAGSRTEMWNFGPEVERVLRRYDNLRYCLLPYTYSEAWRMTSTGQPLMRGLVLDFADDPHATAQTHEFMFGPSILVTPVTSPKSTSNRVIIPTTNLVSADGQPGLFAKYYNGTNFDTLVRTQHDSAVDLAWGDQQLSPIQGWNAKHVSARWTGNLKADEAGEYTISTSADDGVRLWLDGKLVIDDWNAHPEQINSAVIHLAQGQSIDVKLDFFQDTYGAALHLMWQKPVTQSIASSNATEVYLPRTIGGWYDFWTGEHIDGRTTLHLDPAIDILPLHIRAGTILPIGPAVQYAAEKPDGPIELRVYQGTDGVFNLYEDEGDNYNYEKSAYSIIPITWNEKQKALTIGARSGKFSGMIQNRTFRVSFVGSKNGTGDKESKTAVIVNYAGNAVTVHE
jgi:alpha-D-xyloside xylohydrolase